MENYQVLARKYRPQTFNEVIGQDALVTTLTNSILQNKIAHAFILTGIRGVGKTTTARLIAKSLNCIGLDGQGKETITPCLECVHCKSIANSIDQDVVEFDAASHTGVGDIREIIDSIHYSPVASKYKVYIIDEVHMLSNSAFNALLKTLEEPPAHVKFIFATTEIKKVPITILSRCLRFDLPRVKQDILNDHLMKIAVKEGYVLEESASSLISCASEGSVRDSLSLLDRVISFNNFEKEIKEEVVLSLFGLSGKEKTYELYGELLAFNNVKVIELFNEIYLSLISSESFLNDLINITHMLLMKKTNNLNVKNLTTFQKEWVEKNFEKATLSSLFRIWQFLLKSLMEIKNINNDKSFIEILLLKIIYGVDIPEIGDLIKKIQKWEGEAKKTSSINLVDTALQMFDGAKLK